MGARHQVAKDLATDAHPSHSLMRAEFFNPTKPGAKPSPRLFCSNCGVYATTRVLGLKDICTPPKAGVQPKGKPQHHEQSRKGELGAPGPGDPDQDKGPKTRAHKGATKNSLGSLRRKRHPLHGSCQAHFD